MLDVCRNKANIKNSPETKKNKNKKILVKQENNWF